MGIAELIALAEKCATSLDKTCSMLSEKTHVEIRCLLSLFSIAVRIKCELSLSSAFPVSHKSTILMQNACPL